jgi:broad specificity polyphosphatase/5'/3'-nucleotidase SurE
MSGAVGGAIGSVVGGIPSAALGNIGTLARDRRVYSNKRIK